MFYLHSLYSAILLRILSISVTFIPIIVLYTEQSRRMAARVTINDLLSY